MAKDNNEANNINSSLSTPSTSGLGKNQRTAGMQHRSKPYDANNSFVKKVATKVTDLIPQPSWISKWFNSSQDETAIQNSEIDSPQYEEKQSQPPPLKRPCIRMDVTHPPGTFNIKPRNRNTTSETNTSKGHFSNHNDTTQDFLEPSGSGNRMPRFVASTPAFPATSKVSDTRPTLNLLISEQNNAATNGTDDNSESSESTSGCSSLIPQNNRQEVPSNTNYNSPFANKRRYVDDKLNFTNHLQSPRSLFLDSSTRDTLSSRQPSFNPLMVSNTLDRSASLQSPFYPGNTMFGGSNAANLYRRGSSLLAEASQYTMTAPRRTSVQVNPSSESTTSDPSGMSHTARRILEALEQFSSPLTDAKKMPVRNMSGNISNISNIGNNSTLNSSVGQNRKRTRDDEATTPKVGLRHLTRELTIPTVPDLLRIRRRQKLQNTTVNARKIMSARTVPATLNTQEYHIRTEEDTEPKRKAPLKAKKKTNLEEQETVEAVNLPTIALPISNLPRFDISLPQCPKRDIPSNKETQQQTKQMEKSDAFKFASPIKLTESAKNLESINNFTFSKPMSPSKLNFVEAGDSCDLSVTLSVGSNETLTSQPSQPSFLNFMWSGPSQTFKSKEKEINAKASTVANELKSGSVMDFFAKQSSSTSNLDQSNVWECNECLIKNNVNETHCIACKNARLDSSDDIEILECPNEDPSFDTQALEDNKLIKSSTKVLGDLHSNSNSPSVTSNLKGTIVNKPIETIADNLSNPSSTESLNSLQLNVFKPAKASWECPCCMVRNTENVSICPCCNTAKPGSINVSPKRKIESSALPATSITTGFGDKFKKPEGSWSCDVCMIQNKSDANKCVACETPRPSDVKPKAASSLNVISDTTTSSTSLLSGFGDKFKKPEGSWSCDVCMVQNKPDVSKCIACETPRAGITGDSAPPKSSSKLQFNVDMPSDAGSFKFGIDKADNTTNLPTTVPKTNGFTFGAPALSSQSSSGDFSFGIPSGLNKNKESETSKSISFGLKNNLATAVVTSQLDAKDADNKSKEEKAPVTTATFQFGTGSIDTKDKKETHPAAVATFSFGSPLKPDTPKVVSAGFVFGAPASTTENNVEKKCENASAGGLFVFGAQAAAPTQTTTASISNSTSKSMTDVPATNNFLFGSPKPTINSPKVGDKELSTEATVSKVESSKSTQLFSTPVEQSKSAAPTFSFGSSTTTVPPSSTTSASLFTFGAQSKVTDATSLSTSTCLPAFGTAGAPKAAFSFGKPAEQTTNIIAQQENKASNMFGSTAASPSFGSQTNQTTPSLFGSPLPTTSSSENKPLIFRAPENKKTPCFGEPDNKIATFGSTASKLSTGFGTASPVASAFGSTTSSTSTVVSPFGTTPSLFNNGAAPSFPTTPNSNMFSSTTKSSETTATTSGLFTFGQSSQAPTPAATGFNFSAGSNATPNTDQQKNIFSFGTSNNNQQQQVGNGFNGGSFRDPSSTPTTSFTFNAPPKLDANSSTSLFGQATTVSGTTPMFNAPSNTANQPSGLPPAYPGTVTSPPASSGFNFGSTNVPNSFNFGSVPTPSSGGFNLNAPSTPATPAFDPNAQPTFNFTAGSAPTAFNAPPTRKIKKAVRRMPRQ